MKYIKLSITLLIMNAIPSLSHASATGTGKVSEIGGGGWGDNSIYFGLEPVPENRVPCNDHGQYQYIIDVSTEKGKALYSVLLAAWSTDKEIKVQGTGSCPLEAQAEGVSWWKTIK